MNKSWRIKSVVAFLSFVPALGAWSAGVQFSPYLDSNVAEDLGSPASTFGLKLRGNLGGQVSGPRWQIHGDMLAQTLLDGIYNDESKVVANLESGFRYALLSTIDIVGGMKLFRKSFYWQQRSYLWNDYHSYLQLTPTSRITLWAGYVEKSTAFSRFGDTIRFSEKRQEVRLGYAFNPRVSLEGVYSLGNVYYRNYKAWEMVDDTSIVNLEIDQKDESREGMLHLKYQGKVIWGVQVALESVSSNSVIGKYNQTVYRIYLSGRLGISNFFHCVLQRVDKDYRYPELGGITGFRDPEERVQNRTYIQWERKLGGNATGFVQVSILENETIFNQRYYDKTVVELGMKFDL